MAQSTLVVDSVESKTINTKRGEGTLYLIGAGGKEFSTFNRELAVSAAQLKGQTATLSYDVETVVKNGRDGSPKTFENYWLHGLTAGGSVLGPVPLVGGSAPPLSQAGTPPAIQAAIQPQAAAKVNTSKDEDIARAVAFKGAVELAAAGVVTIERATDVCSIAEAFIPWLLGQAEAEPVTVATQPAPPVTDADSIPF